MRSSYIWLIFAAVMAQGCASAMMPPRDEPTKSPQPTAMVAAAVTAPIEATEAPVPAPVIVEQEVPAPPPEGTEDREKAIEWMMGFMKRSAPPGRTTFYAEAMETKEETLVRYREIASAIVDVVYDPDSKTLFRGASGRTRTATVVLSVMLYESGFMKNVDFGVGKFGRGDHGNSWCLVQLNVGSMGTGRTMKWNTKEDRPYHPATDKTADLFEGFTGPELMQDRHRCIREGLKAMRISFTSCREQNLPLEEKLKVFASGNCDEGEDKSRSRMKTAIKFWDDTKAERTFSDKAIVALVATERQTRVAQPAPPAQNEPKPASLAER